MTGRSQLSPFEVGIKLAKELLRTAHRQQELHSGRAAAEAADVLRRAARAGVVVAGSPAPDEPARRYGAALAEALLAYVRSTFGEEDAAAAVRGASKCLSDRIAVAEDPPLEGWRNPGSVN